MYAFKIQRRGGENQSSALEAQELAEGWKDGQREGSRVIGKSIQKYTGLLAEGVSSASRYFQELPN